MASFLAREGRGELKGSTFVHYTGNKGLRSIWEAGRPRAKNINDLIRTIAARVLAASLDVVVRWRPRSNPWAQAADALSHGSQERASTLAPESRSYVTPASTPIGTGV